VTGCRRSGLPFARFRSRVSLFLTKELADSRTGLLKIIMKESIALYKRMASVLWLYTFGNNDCQDKDMSCNWRRYNAKKNKARIQAIQ